MKMNAMGHYSGLGHNLTFVVDVADLARMDQTALLNDLMLKAGVKHALVEAMPDKSERKRVTRLINAAVVRYMNGANPKAGPDPW